MSSILDALKKAQQEEKQKKEKGGDRVVWMVPQKSKSNLSRWATVAGMLAFLAALVWAGVSSMQKAQTEIIREPRKTALKKETALAGLKLEGILWDEKQPFALVNSQMVKKGDVVSGGTVVDISPTQVELSFDGTPRILSLEKE